ncbi:MAG: alanine racemase [Clostridia bacterium]|nr:alanine racemase [Clostridia bacterium]
MLYYSDFIIYKKKLLKNFESLKSKNICAMVKANAYGCGLETICKTLFGKAKFFGVANLQEALQIREFDKYTPILIVGILSDFLTAIDNNISVTIDNINQIENIIKLYKDNYIIKKIKIHIKINSGMNRLGINNKKELKNIFKLIKNNKFFIFEGIFSHFSTADCDIVFFNKQLKLFKEFVDLIPPIFDPIKHIGGSAVLQNINIEKYTDYMFRIGIDLYTKPNLVVRIKSQIIKILQLEKGDRVGYSNGYICKKSTKIAVVPLGYADGINRKLCKNSTVKIKNKKCTIVGNVCMDMFFFDITNLNAKVFDEVLVFDNAFRWAKNCETIPYEILTNINYLRMNYIIIN